MGMFDKVLGAYDSSNYVKGAGKMLGIGQTPEVDAGPGAEGLRDQMNKQTAYAKQLSANQPGLMERQASIQRGQGRGALAQSLTGNRQNFNSRGLLFSGLRKGNEAGLRGEMGSNLAGGIAESNRGVSDQVNAARQGAIQTGQQVANFEQQRESNRIESILGALGKRSEAMAAAGKGLGTGIGTIAGGMETRALADRPSGLNSSQQTSQAIDNANVDPSYNSNSNKMRQRQSSQYGRMDA